MAVVKSGDWWYYEWRIGGRQIRRSSGFRIKEASRDHVRGLEATAKAKVEAELMEKGIVRNTPDKIRLEEAINRMYNDVWSKRRDSEGPLQRCEVVLKIIGNKYLGAIGSDDIAKLKAKLFERGVSGTTVNRYLAALSAVMNRAFKVWEVIDRVPHFPREEEAGNERIRVVTWEEEEKIIAACKSIGDLDFLDFYIVQVDTGMRLSESLTLSYRRDVDFRNNAIVIQARNHKNKKSKGIPLTKRAREVLFRRQSLGNVGPFSQYHRYEPLYRLKKVLKAAGLQPEGDILVHSFRDTFASRLANEGVPIYEVSNLLGHSSVTVTEKRYAQLFIDRLRTSISTLDKAIETVDAFNRT